MSDRRTASGLKPPVETGTGSMRSTKAAVPKGQAPDTSDPQCAIIAQNPTNQGEAEILREALEPFATFAETFIDDEGWTGPMSKERIVDWFGPSDFRRAAQALTAQGGKG